MKVASFGADLDFDESKIKTKILLETSFSKEVRILMMKGQLMKEHKSTYPITIHVLDGEINLGVAGTHFTMSIGDIIFLEGNMPHDLTANQNSVIRLTLSKTDKVERVNAVLTI